MTLNKKILFILILALSVFASLNYGIHHYVILPGFKALEVREATKDMERCVWELKDEINHVDKFCHDLAAWDNLYEFVNAPSADFIERNLNDDTLIANEVSFICIVDKSGSLLFGEAWDLSTNGKTVLTTLPKTLHPVTRFPSSPGLGPKELAVMKHAGLYNSHRGPMMLSSRPIVTSNHLGPVRGAVVVGRLLDPAAIDAMTTRVALRFRFLDANDERLTQEERSLLAALGPDEIKVMEPPGDDILKVYSRLPDIGGDNLIQAEIPKHILEKGRTTYTYSLVLISVLGLFISLLITALIKKVVLSPVMKLTRHVLEIATSGDLTARITLPQNDEIGALAREVNRMLVQIECQREEITEMNETLNTIIETSQVGIMALRGGRTLYKGNQRLADILGYESPESMVGLSTRELHVSEENYRAFGQTYVNKLVHGSQTHVEYELRRRDNTPVWCTLSGKAVDSATPADLEKGVVWMVDDITKIKQNREKLQKLATTDPLTGLFNRRQLMKLAAVEMNRQGRYTHIGLTLAILDIDYFKKINDTHGHASGDMVLKAFADIGRNVLRDVDIFARIGGEEFVILLPGTKLMGALEAAERFRREVEQSPVRVNGEDIPFTVSLGVTEWNGTDQTIENMLEHADRALYAAKHNGRNRVEVYELRGQKPALHI